MDRLHLFQTFVAIHEAASISAVARQTGSSVATVSRQLTALEAELGAQLFHRTSRSLKLSEAGSLLLPHAMAVLKAYADATQSMAEGRHLASIRISAPIALSHAFVTASVSQFALDHPHAHVELMVENRKASAVGEGLDVLVQAGLSPLADSPDLIVKDLGRYPLWICAAPSLLSRHRKPTHPQDLVAAPIPWVGHLAYRPMKVIELVQDKRGVKVPYDSRFWTNDLDALLRAAHEGVGMAILPKWQAQPSIRSRKLVRLFPDWHLPDGRVWVAWRRGRNQQIVRQLVQRLQKDFEPLR